jgi:hypothetical protein
MCILKRNSKNYLNKGEIVKHIKFEWARNIFKGNRGTTLILTGFVIAFLLSQFLGYKPQTVQAQTRGEVTFVDCGSNIYFAHNSSYTTQSKEVALALGDFLTNNPQLRLVTLEYSFDKNGNPSSDGWVIVCEPKDSSTGKQ